MACKVTCQNDNRMGGGPYWAAGGPSTIRGGGDLYLLGLLTGLRRRSLTTIEREHINRRVPDSIYIPKPKGGEDRAFDVPLSDAAKSIVEHVLKSHNSKWLFPSDESKSGHIEDPREFTPWKGAAGKKVTFTLHGLRASYIGAAHAAGVSDRHTKLLANHAVHKSDVHGGYILAEADALREAQQRIYGLPPQARPPSLTRKGPPREAPLSKHEG
jgi:integrase